MRIADGIREQDDPLSDIEWSDGLEVKDAMKVASNQPPRRPLVEDHDPTDEYPLGQYPSWSQVQASISKNPLGLLRLWTFDPALNDIMKTAAELFKAFCWQTWCGLNPYYLTSGWTPTKDITLEEGIRLWSAVEVYEHVRNVQWKAIKTKAKFRGRGQRKDDFPARLSMYFPKMSSKPKNGPWLLSFQHHWYIHEYNRILESSNAETVTQLHQALGTLFGHLQCLPDSQRCTPKTAGRTWTHKSESIVMLINPNLCRYDKAVTKSTRRRSGFPSAHAKPSEHLGNLLQGAGLNAQERKEMQKAKKREENEKNRNNRRSGKSKNARRPPTALSRKSQPTVETSQVTEDASVDDQSDERGETCMEEVVQEDFDDTVIEIMSSSEEGDAQQGGGCEEEGGQEEDEDVQQDEDEDDDSEDEDEDDQDEDEESDSQEEDEDDGDRAQQSE